MSPLARRSLGITGVLGEMDRLSDTVLEWRQSLDARAVAAKDASLCLKDQVQPLLQAWQDAVPAARMVFQARRDRFIIWTT